MPGQSGVRLLRALLFLIAAISASLLFCRAVAGPFAWAFVSVKSPVNLECILALAVLFTLLTSGGVKRALPKVGGQTWWPVALIPIAVGVSFWQVLSMPLVTDDYTHMEQIRRGEFPSPLESLLQPTGGPHVFRPVGAALFWIEWRLWGRSAGPRHALDLLLHAASSILFLFLARRLGLAPPFDLLAGLLFALYAIRPEVVAWPGARFDALAVFFSLIAALSILRGTRLLMWLSVALACLSKESAFVLPLMLALVLGREVWTKPGLRLALSSLAVAASVFLWRFMVLRGIGGYSEADGSSTVLHFNLLNLLKTFLFRMWGILWFPINWSRPLEWWMISAFAVGLPASLLLVQARPYWKPIALCLLAVVVACLPVYNMLLIDASLERSRYLAYAVPAFVMFVTFAYRALPPRLGTAGLVAIIAFHAIALQHNLRIWGSVASERSELCRSIAAQVRQSPTPIYLTGVPTTVDGVYWRNGLEACLDLEFGVPVGTVHVNETAK